MKFEFGDGQYTVYANNEHEARLIIGEELARFDKIKYLMCELLTENGQAWKNFMNNSSEDRLYIYFNDEKSLIYDKDPTARGEVRRNRADDANGNFSYDLAYRYPNIQGHNADFRLAHEMGHLMLNPSKVDKQIYDKTTDTIQVAGLIRVPKGQEHNKKSIYGNEIQENTINLLAQLAIRGKNRADDIISGKVDLSEYNSYKRCDDLVKLLAVSMRNDFDKEMSFEQLMTQKIDSSIVHSDGTQEPANTFFYGILNDSSIIQKEFDKYMGKGEWRKLNTAFKELYKKEISQEKFDEIFNATQGLIVQFAKERMQVKYREAAQRDGDINIPGLDEKMKMIQEMTKGQNLQTIQTNEQIGYINEFGEIIRPNNEEEVKDEQQSTNVLSLKQKVAQFLRKNNIFMNLTFVKNFVNNQLNVLTANTEKRPSAQVAKNRLRQDFENWLSNNGEFKNLPVSRRLSDPDRMVRMQRKMDTKRTEDYEKFIK